MSSLLSSKFYKIDKVCRKFSEYCYCSQNLALFYVLYWLLFVCNILSTLGSIGIYSSLKIPLKLFLWVLLAPVVSPGTSPSHTPLRSQVGLA